MDCLFITTSYFIAITIQVYMESMSHDDLVTITYSLYPDLDKEMIQKMVIFNDKVRHVPATVPTTVPATVQATVPATVLTIDYVYLVVFHRYVT